MSYGITQKFAELRPYEADIDLRMARYAQTRARLLRATGSQAGGRPGCLRDFADAHLCYGFHRLGDGSWAYREWAPAADGLYLAGDFNGWQQTATPLSPVGNGDWEVLLPADAFDKGRGVVTVVRNGDELAQHLPLFARRVVQDWQTGSWCCEVVEDGGAFPWTDAGFSATGAPIIYESHVGMASEQGRIATWLDFANNVLPHVAEAGYNTVQLMAVAEHPYYASFGYQVGSFFAPSSRFGTPDDLRYLVNKAHSMGIRVLMDVVHSHASANTLDGINRFDGSDTQFFHEGPRGDHPAWGTKCFDYAKDEVLRFLLSNLRYWVEEFHFDGFRFDGVTSMLYLDHGLGRTFDGLDAYFSPNTDVDAVVYLQLANELVHGLNPRAITVAEDMSGMPGTCEAVGQGGLGFDYRLAMGIPDLWIRLVKEQRDEDWDLGAVWGQLTFRNARTIAYVESHDQALVGDQTLMFRLAGAAMYDQMEKTCHTLEIDRAVALHKMIRLLTLGAGGDGWLAFMGNEFGHPEWIDFPREGNGGSFKYCRRQWSLLADDRLKYVWLGDFDRDMLRATTGHRLFDESLPHLRVHDEARRVLAFERGGLLFAFNFDADRAYEGYGVSVGRGCDYQMLFSTDDPAYGGQGRIAHMRASAFAPGIEGNCVRLYLPPRTAVVLTPVEGRQADSQTP